MNRRGWQYALVCRSLTGDYCRDCGGRMIDGRHIDSLDDGDHAAVSEDNSFAGWTNEMIANHFGQSRTIAEIEALIGRKWE